MKNKSGIKMILLVLIQCFLLSNSSWGNSITGSLRIQSQYGSIKEVFESASATAKPTIINIQDAHCNYEAQKNMTQILQYLVNEHHLRLIMVEGGSGDVGLSFLRSYADKKTREEVADRYLMQGKISGEEYLDIVSDYNIELYGIEDEGLYDAHLSAFFKVDSIKDESLKYLDSLSGIVEELKPHIYNPQLQEFETQKKNYEDKTVSLADYCGYLKKTADKKGLERSDYSQISDFSETARLEKEIDFKLAETERNNFIKELAKLLDEEALKELVNKSQDFKAGKLAAQDYYSFLKKLADKKIDLRQNYAHLDSYIRYITVSKKVNAADLLKEVSAAEEKIRGACFTTTDQRRLNEVAKSIRILKGILSLELTPEEYDYFRANRSKFTTSSWVNFLGENCRKYNLAAYPSASSVIDDNLFKLNEFYKLGAEREDAFIKNIVSKLNESGEKIAVLITGGFHTPGLTQKLKEEGYSYAVVTPTITKKGDSSIYFSILKGESKALSKADYIEDEE